jgi:hypothetical protein
MATINPQEFMTPKKPIDSMMRKMKIATIEIPLRSKGSGVTV